MQWLAIDNDFMLISFNWFSILCRILGKLTTVAEKDIKGAPYVVTPMAMADGSIKLLAGINSTVSDRHYSILLIVT